MLFEMMGIKKINKRHKNFLVFITFFLSYFFFFLSLEKCTQGEDICCGRVSWMKKKVFEESISCIFTIILLQLIIVKKISKLHLFHFIMTYTLFFIYSHGIDFDNHGYYNIKYFFIIVISTLVFIFFLNWLLSIKEKKIIFLFIITFIFLLFLLKPVLYLFYSCNDWKIGLNNTSIDNNENKYNCLIQMPKYCPYKIGKYFFDINKFSPLNCSKNESNLREKILLSSKSPFISFNTLHIGFPIINKDEKFFHDMNFSLFKNYIYENYVDMDNLTLLHLLKERKPEISVDFSKNINGKMNINLIFNKTLSDERKKFEILTGA